MSQVPFNPAQLSSWKEATHYAKIINTSAPFLAAGIQILPQNPPHSGVYLPAWVGGPHADPEPQIGDAIFLHFRFNNGMEGMNAGLVREKFRSFPQAPAYVLNQLLIEVQKGARS